jgi:hypothetical protein
MWSSSVAVWLAYGVHGICSVKEGKSLCSINATWRMDALLGMRE